MLPSDYLISQLATLMWQDQSDGTNGMVARGLLVRNRVTAGWRGASWLENIANFNPESFSPPVDEHTPILGDPHRDKLFIHILGQAASIYEGRSVGSAPVKGPDGKLHGGDMISGALWSARLDQCSAEFAEKIVRGGNHERVAQVGLRSFFK